MRLIDTAGRQRKAARDAHYVLDMKDKKILSLLANDARTPFTTLGKKVGLSKDAVRYRVKTYEERGLVRNYLSIINLAKFGYMTYHLLLQLNKPAEREERKIINRITAFPFVRAVLRFSGRYDLQVALVARSIAELEAHHECILRECGPYLERSEPLLITSTYTSLAYPGNLFDLKETELETGTGADGVDETDKKLLRRIASDARAPLYELGQSVGLSADAVSYRLKHLRQASYIKRYVAAINYEIIGYQLYLVLFDMRSFTVQDEAKLRELLRQNSNIVWCVKAIGHFNLLLYLVTTDARDVHRVTDTLRTHFPRRIREHETLLAFEEHKYTYLPDNLEI